MVDGPANRHRSEPVQISRGPNKANADNVLGCSAHQAPRQGPEGSRGTERRRPQARSRSRLDCAGSRAARGKLPIGIRSSSFFWACPHTLRSTIRSFPALNHPPVSSAASRRCSLRSSRSRLPSTTSEGSQTLYIWHLSHLPRLSSWWSRLLKSSLSPHRMEGNTEAAHPISPSRNQRIATYSLLSRENSRTQHQTTSPSVRSPNECG